MMHELARPLRSNRGFTLTEIMVVLVIFGVMMIVAIPNVQKANQTHALNTSVSQIESSMRRARSVAATKRTPVRVNIDAGNRECTVDQDTDDDGNFETRLATYELSEDVQLSEIRLGAGGTSVVFDERGAPDNPGTIVVRTRDGDGRELLISAGSGSVMVMKADAPVSQP